MKIQKTQNGYVGMLKMGKWWCMVEGETLQCVTNKLFYIAEKQIKEEI